MTATTTTAATTATRTLVRDDVPDARPETRPSSPGRLWALSGVGAAATGVAGIVATMAMNAVYDPAVSGNAEKVLDAMAAQRTASSVFHVLTAASAMLLVPFAAGLHRRLRAALPADSLLPVVAAAGVVVTSVVLVLGSGLDTEFGSGLPGKGQVVAENVSMYGHWVGTIPYLWTGMGLAGIALAAAARHRAVARWVGVVGLLLGGVTLVAGVSPLEYLAGLVGPLWLLATATGFLVGDRAHRR